MNFLEAHKTVVFFTRDFFDKCYGGLNATVHFGFWNITFYERSPPPHDSTIGM